MSLDVADSRPAHIAEWLANGAQRLAHRKNFASGGMALAQRMIGDVSDGRCRFTVADPRRFIDFAACEVKLGGTAIRFMRWNSDTDCEKVTARAPDRRNVTLHYVLRGECEAIQGESRVCVRAGQVLIKAAGGHTIKRWHGVCEMLIVFVTRDALARMIAEDKLGSFSHAAIDLAPLTVVELSSMATLARFIATAVADLGEDSSSFDEPALAIQAERTLHLLFLKSFASKNGLPCDGTANIVPFYLRRAESYMRENLASDIDVGMIAAACGVSPRTLQYAFKTYRDSSPGKCLKAMRLAAARTVLEGRVASRMRIAEVAQHHGYRSVAQFSRDYRAQFCETPSDTVRR
jgi:AraC-like DNA-binding protein